MSSSKRWAPEVEVPSGFDAVLHPPARLQIAAVLAQAQEAEFALLKTITGASDSVMSKHLAALTEAGYVTIRKAPSDGRQRTWAKLTGAGRAAFRNHVKALEALAAAVASRDLDGQSQAVKKVRRSA